MRIFLIKLLNILLIAGIIFCYQDYAMERQKEEAAYKKELSEYEQAKLALERPYKNGVFEGTGKGFGGDVKVQVTIEEYRIKEVIILSAEKETREYLEAAKKLLADIVDEQSAQVDGVAGATLSSNGILAGVKDALKQAENTTDK